MASFKKFNRITTDYADVLNKLFKNFIQFTALQYKGKLISNEDSAQLIDSDSHNDLSRTLNKYKAPLWQQSDLRKNGKFSLVLLLPEYNKLKYKNPNSSILSFIDAQEIGPRRIHKISSIALSLIELRNKIAHGYYVENEAEAAGYWANLAQLIMSYPPKLIKDDIKSKFDEMQIFIKGELLQSWINFYEQEEDLDNDGFSSAEENFDVTDERQSLNNTIQAALDDFVEIMEMHNQEVIEKITHIQKKSNIEIEEVHEVEDQNIDEDDSEEIIPSEENKELLTEQEAMSALNQLKGRIHKEMKYTHKNPIQNWECIVQWSLIHSLLSSFPKSSEEFKNTDTFQLYYNSEQYKRATEESKIEARRLMDLQLELYWDDIQEIIERTERN